MVRRRYRRRTPLTTHLFRVVLVLLGAAVGDLLYAKWRVETTVSDTLDGWASQASAFGQLRYLDVTNREVLSRAEVKERGLTVLKAVAQAATTGGQA